MTDHHCDIRHGHLFAHCVTCKGTAHDDDFACPDWARRFTMHNLAAEIRLWMRETRRVFPEIEIEPAHVARAFKINEEDARALIDCFKELTRP